MTHRFLTQYADRDHVDEIFLASEKQLRPNRQGNLYLQVRLSDRTGSVVGMLWNAGEQQYNLFNNGDYVRVQGAAQVYNGALQIILTRIERADSRFVNEEDFITLGQSEVDKLAQKMAGILRGIRNVHLRNLADCFLMDEEFMAKFIAAPAGIKNHHAYKGGLLQHVVSLLELCQVVAPRYPELDSDLLLIGAFLHDAAKIDEMTYERDLGYSDEGQLIGHVVMAVGMVADKAREAGKLAGEPFPRELLLRVQHMIVSHHGEYEYGSPKLPMTLEAVALHLLDTLDARMFSIAQIIRDDANSDSVWTPYYQALGRKFYKG